VLTGDTAPVIADVTGLTWDALRDAEPLEAPYASWTESPALWLYTSGTTGTPKGAMHRHVDIRYVCETYAQQVLGVGRDDVCLSGAKLFFAYGLGNSLLFPLSVGASAVLEPSRPNPTLFAERIVEHGVTLFFGGPSFWGPLIAARLPRETFATVRNGVSAGEALPARMYQAVKEQYGFEILDGIGSTEALHIFISNVAGKVVPGTSGFPVPGYRVEIRRADGTVVEGPDEPGMLWVAGESLCTGYWCRTDVNRMVFHGEWMRTGRHLRARRRTAAGSASAAPTTCLKVAGIWVSPTEVETRVLEHPRWPRRWSSACRTPTGWTSRWPTSWRCRARDVDEAEVIAFCRARLAAFKRPRRVFAVTEIPKTATGKIQRFRLREHARDLHAI
jgi:benzoate-CoA ligase